MTMHASGAFDVKLVPQSSSDDSGTAIGRMTIDKQFHGDLAATSKGQMLAHRSGIDGSAGYVAMEIVSGTLGDRQGTFVLRHTGTMTRGARELSVTVVPDSGTGDLVGLSGRMEIIIAAGGEHSYTFEYAFGGVG